MYQWRIQGCSPGVSKSRKFKWLMKVGATNGATPLIYKIMAGGGVSGQPENPPDTPLCTAVRTTTFAAVTKIRLRSAPKTAKLSPFSFIFPSSYLTFCRAPFFVVSTNISTNILRHCANLFSLLLFHNNLHFDNRTNS